MTTHLFRGALALALAAALGVVGSRSLQPSDPIACTHEERP